MDKSEYSQDPYEDGTVPADADLVTSSDDDGTDDGGTDDGGPGDSGADDGVAPEPHDEASAEVHPS